VKARNCIKGGRRRLRGRDSGGHLTNMQYKPIWNCHNESPLYNKYILVKKGGSKNYGAIRNSLREIFNTASEVFKSVPIFYCICKNFENIVPAPKLCFP
jgi:hypothetical protein